MSAPSSATHEHMPMGNPGPLGLLGFIVTTAIDMYVVCGWVEEDFEAYIVAYGLMFGGWSQWVAGVLSIIKGDSYSGSLFGLYGGYWMAFGVQGIVAQDPTSTWHTAVMPKGVCGLKILIGVITFLYWTLAWRKSTILFLILPCVWMLLFLQAGYYGTGNEGALAMFGHRLRPTAIATVIATGIATVIATVVATVRPCSQARSGRRATLASWAACSPSTRERRTERHRSHRVWPPVVPLMTEDGL